MIALLALTLLNPLIAPSPSLDAEFESALGIAGLSTTTAIFDPGILSFYRQSEKPMSFYESCFQNPWKTPYFMEMTRKQFQLSLGQPAGLIENASRMVGNGSRRSLLGDSAESAIKKSKITAPLQEALSQLKIAGILKTSVPTTSQVPLEIQKAAAALIFATLEAVDYRRAAFKNVPDLAAAYSQVQALGDETSGPLAEKQQRDLQDLCDMTYLYAGSQQIASACYYANSLLRLVPQSTKYSFTIDTAWGKIDLSGGSDSTHDGSATFICIDTGGSDTYINTPSNSSVANWVSIVLDSAGKDNYLSDPALAKTKIEDWSLRTKNRGTNGPASALFGVSILMDQEGDDLYRTSRSGLGSATFGISYLGDSDGNDTYDSYTNAIGFGHYGIGIVDDTSGSDNYSGFSQVEGVGLPQGFGSLLDKTGADTYVANDKILDFPSAQTADHNNSMSQGAGYGFRADYLTGHSQSGGVGLLFDLEGKDSYSCGVFGQGTGYWEGVGMIWDSSGNDTYTGQWYVQGASAHFGIGYLEDSTGDDKFVAQLNMGLGAGHDFGLGFLIDHEGDDQYAGQNLVLGVGNANGIGVFVDRQGNDKYVATGTMIGSSSEVQKSSLRERAICLGVFMDLGGSDNYPDGATWAKNGVRTTNWNFKGDKPAESQLGVFLDR